MLAKAINHKLHSLYTFAIVQLEFESKSKFEDALKYMKQAYGPGICHNRKILHPAYSRNTGDNRIWYYSSSNTRYGFASGTFYRIYLTTPEQLTMVGLLFS